LKVTDTLETKTERILLVGTIRHGNPEWEVKETLTELELLTKTAGGEVFDIITQDIKSIDPAYFIGKGKAEYIGNLTKIYDIDTVIFNDDLSPAQAHNLETVINKKIVDRSWLILDIFAKNAKTREAKTQVELAQLEYLLPRLTGHWKHLSRQVGGIGVKGPGETQLETDRRIVQKRIEKLKSELLKINKQKVTQRKKRNKVFKAILVGYTNAGKSTILNNLTDANVLVEDKLFATLDSTVKRLNGSDHQTILLADTVGFIRKLPHHLIASFRSTLNEIEDANLIVHIIDMSHPNFEKQMEAVNKVLVQLNVSTKPKILVFNKIDLVRNDYLIARIKKEYTDAILISAYKELGLNKLVESIYGYAYSKFFEMEITIPNYRSKLISEIYDTADVIDTTYEDNQITMKLRVNNYLRKKIEKISGGFESTGSSASH